MYNTHIGKANIIYSTCTVVSYIHVHVRTLYYTYMYMYAYHATQLMYKSIKKITWCFSLGLKSESFVEELE